MLHHIDFTVADFARSREFYVYALAPLGLSLIIEFRREDGRELAGFGQPPDPEFWIRSGGQPPGRWHVAFSAATREQVDAFYQAALAAGGTDNGAPCLRPRYADPWYAAYVLDPDGHNIEVVCRR